MRVRTVEDAADLYCCVGASRNAISMLWRPSEVRKEISGPDAAVDYHEAAENFAMEIGFDGVRSISGSDYRKGESAETVNRES
jgi:hypothetical protein